jgi:Ca-activated chloride channel homolog
MGGRSVSRWRSVSVMRICGTVMLCVAAAAAARAQRDAPLPAFRSGIDLVAINVTVTDDRRGVVTDLGAADFVVREEGVPQEIAVFWRGQAPLDVAILVDASTSMGWQFRAMRAAALAFVSSLRAGDRAAVIAVRWQSELVHPLDGDLAGAARAIGAMRVHGATALYDGLAMAFAQLAPATIGAARRRAIIVLSDGEDTASMTEFDTVLQRAKESGATVYTIAVPLPLASTRAARRNRRDAELVAQLAEVTGGVSFYPTSADDLGPVYGLVAHDLATQYLLGYTPGPVDPGAWRSITVEVRDRPDLHTRTRRGYSAVTTSAMRR